MNVLPPAVRLWLALIAQSVLVAGLQAAEPQPQVPGPNAPLDRRAPEGKQPTAAQTDEQQNPRTANTAVRTQPRVLKYDVQNDAFIYLDSRTGQQTYVRPGGSLAYHGTKLTQFRFRGPAQRGGIYRDLEDYREQTQPDPQHYQYRWGNYARNGQR